MIKYIRYAPVHSQCSMKLMHICNIQTVHKEAIGMIDS